MFNTGAVVAGFCFTVIVPTAVAMMWPTISPATGWTIIVIASLVGAAAGAHGLGLYELPSQPRSVWQRKKWNYLSDVDVELSSAILQMAWFSAWAKWYAAQHLATNEHKPIEPAYLLNTVAFVVLTAATNGLLQIRGRPRGEIEYEAISKEAWRLAALKVEPNATTLWKTTVIPRAGVAPDRIRQMLDYDSLIVSGKKFETLWPRVNKTHDRARKRALKAATKAGANPDAVKKLATGEMAF